MLNRPNRLNRLTRADRPNGPAAAGDGVDSASGPGYLEIRTRYRWPVMQGSRT